MAVEILQVGQLKTNCYLFSNNNTIIIDPGDDAEFIINRITDLKLKPVLILATHGHFDHILAATELKLAYGIPFCISKEDFPIVKRMKNTAYHFTGIKSDPPPIVDKYLKPDEVLELGLEVMETPGHTPGSLCFYSKKEKLIFTGDTVFAEGSYGRTDLPGGDKDEITKSIKKILSLPSETKIYPGHGKSSTVKQEKTFFNLPEMI